MIGKCGEDEHDRGGIVVDDERRLGSAQPSEKSSDPGLAASASSRSEVELQVLCPGSLCVGNWCSAEIRMGDHTRCVDDRNEKAGGDLFCDRLGKRHVTASDCFTRCIDEKRMRETGVRDQSSECIDAGRSVNHPDQRYCAIVILFLLFVIVPIVELYTIIKMSSYIGFFNTLGVMFLVAVLGSWLVKREGIRVWRRFNDSVAAGKVPTRDIVDGVLILGAGALLLTPGFFSDIFGLLMLFPPSRAVFRSMLLKRSQRNIIVLRRMSKTYPSDAGRDVIDTDATDVRGDLPEG